MPPHPLKYFEIEKYYQSDRRFNSVYSRYNLPKIKYESIRTQWIALYVNARNIVYSDSFGDDHILKEIKKFIRTKNIITNSYRIQEYNLVICWYFGIGFIGFMLKRKICLIIQIYFLL